MPILGPSAIRDIFGLGAGITTDPLSYIEPKWFRYSLWSGRLIDIRSRLLAGDKLVHDSFDPYVFVRDAYLQNRDKQIEENHGSYLEYQCTHLSPEYIEKHARRCGAYSNTQESIAADNTSSQDTVNVTVQTPTKPAATPPQ